jgi:hypothetical protein
MANGIIDTLKNYYNVATGSGLHEQAMREYLDPFTGGQTYQISEGPVAEYMSNYLKDYTKPDNKVAQAFSEGRRGPGQMRVVGLGESPNPFSVSGIAKAAEMAENPSFQAENLFGEGTLTKVPGGYDYTGGKFDFAADNPVTNFLQDKVFKPSEYVMKFDENFKPLEKFDRDFRNFDQARMGRDILEDDLMKYGDFSELMESDTTKKEGILSKLNPFKAIGFLVDLYTGGSARKALGRQGVGKLFGMAKDAVRDRFVPASYGTSQAAFNAMTPSQQQAVGSIYGQGGIMQGYNPVSFFGRGPASAIQNRIDNILGRKAPQTAASRAKVRQLQQALTDVGGGDGGGRNQNNQQGGFDLDQAGRIRGGI